MKCSHLSRVYSYIPIIKQQLQVAVVPQYSGGINAYHKNGMLTHSNYK